VRDLCNLKFGRMHCCSVAEVAERAKVLDVSRLCCLVLFSCACGFSSTRVTNDIPVSPTKRIGVCVDKRVSPVRALASRLLVVMEACFHANFKTEIQLLVLQSLKMASAKERMGVEFPAQSVRKEKSYLLTVLVSTIGV